MLRNSLKAGQPFKSPMTLTKKKVEVEGGENGQSELENLKVKEASLDQEIKVLEADNSIKDLEVNFKTP